VSEIQVHAIPSDGAGYASKYLVTIEATMRAVWGEKGEHLLAAVHGAVVKELTEQIVRDHGQAIIASIDQRAIAMACLAPVAERVAQALTKAGK
jgi:hypothetical protein